MKKQHLFYFSFLFVLMSTNTTMAQEWESIGTIGGIAVSELFPDTVSDKLYIGGRFGSVDGIITRNITCFDGHEFEKMTDSSTINACWNLGCLGVSSIIRYQDKIIASSIRSATYETDPQIIGIGAWDGTEWHPLDGGLSMGYNDIVFQYRPAEISDFCLTGDTLYAAGSILFVDSLPALGLAAWDGTSWHTFNVPEPNSEEFMLAYCVSKYKGNIYLGGNILYYLNGEEVRDLIRYDGVSWQKVGEQVLTGFNTHIRDLEVFQDKLYMAGYFTQAGGNPGNSIVSWDGEQWNDLGGGVCGYGIIDDLFVHEDKLYVAGLFDCIGGIEARNVAVWDGTKWCSIGHSTFNRAANAIAVWNDTIYVGGGFYEIDGQPVHYLARFVGDPSGSVCSEPVSAVEPAPAVASALTLSPNPAGNVLTINRSGTGRLLRYEVVDMLGRTWWSCSDCADRQEVPVTGWPAGSYVVRAVCEGGVVAKAFVKG